MKWRMRNLGRMTDEGKRKALGAFLVLTGVSVLMRTLPLWTWLAFMGAGMAWLGWSMLYQ